MIWAYSFAKKQKNKKNKKQKQKQKQKQNKTKKTGLTLFKSIFLRETDPWITLGDFAVKNAKLEGESALNWKSIK